MSDFLLLSSDFSLELVKEKNTKLASVAIIVITTSISIKVKPCLLCTLSNILQSGDRDPRPMTVDL